jgi:hypothetical protein
VFKPNKLKITLITTKTAMLVAKNKKMRFIAISYSKIRREKTSGYYHQD